jgi:hypothetical protein
MRIAPTTTTAAMTGLFHGMAEDGTDSGHSRGLARMAHTTGELAQLKESSHAATAST